MKAILEYKDFEKAGQTCGGVYEEMIEKQSSLEARSQPKLQELRTLYESECVAAQGDGRFSDSFV